MKTVKCEKKLCLMCMQEHDIQTIIQTDTELYKNQIVSFNAAYEYCEFADELLETEEMIKSNSLAMKDAFRKKTGFLTSYEIMAIREKYKVSQKDFSEILDWGKATITRYENHQIQDRAHDDVLRKIESDPKWFLQMLDRTKGKISDKAFEKYRQAASVHYKKTHNRYLMDSIYALYADFKDNEYTGGVELNLNKVVEVINYFALKVSSLHKVKLMKMLWYGDAVNYKKTGKAITGLVYNALPMGAVPVGYDQIIDLEGIEYETVIYDFDRWGYKFYPVKGFQVNELSTEETCVLDVVISEVGHLNAQEIVNKMHDEEAYKRTERNGIIPFTFADSLSI